MAEPASPTADAGGRTAAASAVGVPGEVFGRKEGRLIRDRFMALRDRRLVRIKRAMHREQRQFLELLPLLFHVNHPLLPGFVNTDTPAGIADYSPSHHEILLARRHARSFAPERRALARYPIRGLYLMGSLGTLGQEAASDLDVWLCYARDLSAEGLEALTAKAERIEAWGASLGLRVYVFPMQAEAFRDGESLPLSEESSGGLGRDLLLEEFYRTNILLAGLPPLWWLVPPDKEHEYTEYTARLYRQRFVSPNAWLDFGGLDRVPAAAFYEAAHWQLHKSIAAPYKALLKLLLFEAYAADFPHVHWVSRRIKEAVFARGELEPDQLDPYLLILDRIGEHMAARQEPARHELARRAFYVKAGQALSRRVSHADWKRRQMTTLVESWGWRRQDLLNMDNRYRWKLDQVQGERNALVAELSRAYRMLTEFARREQAAGHLDNKELSLLGRQFYAALERRPGKVERINPGISQDLSEPVLWIDRELGPDGERWLLYRQPPDQGDRAQAAKAAASLVELLAWTHINGLADAGTPLHCPPLPPEPGVRQHIRMLQIMARQLPRRDLTPSTLEAFRQPPTVQTSLLFIDAGHPQNLDEGRHQIDHLFLTSWGEILVERHLGSLEAQFDILCRHLDMTPQQQVERPPVFRTFSFAPAHVQLFTAQLDRLAHAVWDTVRQLGPDARYVGRIESRLYLVERPDQHFRWTALGHAPELIETLGRTTKRFRPTRVDPAALPGSPLPTLLEQNRRGQVQMFYRVGTAGIDMWVLDDNGSLFEQHLPQAQEQNFLSHQRRFFENLLTRRLLLAADPQAPLEDLRVHIQQILYDGRHWLLRDAELPEEHAGSYLDLTLVTGGPEQVRAGYQLICGEREFDSLMLGERFYAVVANHILQKRRPGPPYPIYVTGIQPAGLESRVSWPVTEMLRLKRLLERRLNARIGLSGPAEPDV